MFLFNSCLFIYSIYFLNLIATRYYNGYNSCHRCNTSGESVKRVMTFVSCGTLRTDDSFRKRTDEDHHDGVKRSPIEKIVSFNLVKGFVAADALHMLDLGIIKAMLARFIHPTRKRFKKTKFSAHDMEQISNFLVKSNKYMPCELHRSVRSIESYKYWKGVEYRQFFFYLAPIVYKTHLTEPYYKHFLMLYCAVTICTANR